MPTTLDDIAERIARLERWLTPAVKKASEEAIHAAGLLSYEDLQDRLTVGLRRPRKPCMRTVRAIVARHRGTVRPVEIGHTLIGFRPANVEKLIRVLEGEDFRNSGGTL